MHDDECPDDPVEHIAAIEAGWTLPKPWKAVDEVRQEEENRTEVAEMLARWREHGIVAAVGKATFGSIPDLTGGEDSVEFVRRRRE